MKKILMLCSLFLSLSFVLTNAQELKSFIPDVDGTTQKAIINTNTQNTITPLFNTEEFNMYTGFPLIGTYTLFSPKTGAIYCNLDADPEMEILYGHGEKLEAVNLDGTSIPGFPITYDSYYECAWAPSFGDIDGDGEGEIVAGVGGPFGGHIQAYEKDGSVVTGFPVVVGKYPLTPILADLNNDGSLEIIMGTRTSELLVYKGDGTAYTGWPQMMDKYVASSCAAGDINNDGTMNVIAESRNNLYAWNEDGTMLPGFPYPIMDSNIGSNSYAAPVLADVNNDGNLEISFCSHSDSVGHGGVIYLVDHNGNSLPGWPQTVPAWIYGAPIFADIDGDNEVEIIVGEYGSSSTPLFSIFAYNLDGSLVSNFPVGPFHGSANQLTVADIDNDSQYEIIFDENVTIDGNGRYQAIEVDGTPVAGWPLEFTQNSSFQQPLLGDLNNDGNLDLVGSSFSYDVNNKEVFLFAWDLGVPYNPLTIVNPMYQFSATHQGVYKKPLNVPVELLSFGATQLTDAVRLDWITATETNNQGFRISKNNKVIGFVDGKGTTIEKQNYSFTDDFVQEGNNTYKLEQIDFDGTVNDAGNITLSTSSLPEEYSLEQNYPNPFNPTTNISYSLKEAGQVKLTVFNSLGEVVEVVVNEFKDAGSYRVNFNANNLSTGIYFYSITTNDFTATKKMMLLK